jgi:hypothetical protein
MGGDETGTQTLVAAGIVDVPSALLDPIQKRLSRGESS